MLTTRRRLLAAGVTQLLLLVFTASALAASPTPAAPPGGDPRSPGEGPGFVGDPAMAIGVVLAIGVASVVLTYLYVLATRGRKRNEGP